jgi:uncharacterized repeat protein (TIGR04076 family)
MAEQIGHKVTGTIMAKKGECTCNHRVGDRFELSIHSPGGLCGFFYHTIFPYICMLQFGGGFPEEWGNPNVLELDCPDVVNTVRIQLVRESYGPL